MAVFVQIPSVVAYPNETSVFPRSFNTPAVGNAISMTSLIWSIMLVYLSCCFLHIWQKLFSSKGIPKSIPWVAKTGEGYGPVSRARATMQSFFGMQEIIKEGYQKYSKKNRTFVLPNLIHGPEVILPPSQMRWLLEQPDSVLSQHEVNRRLVSADITLLHKNITQEGNAIHGKIIRKEMTREQDSYTNDLIDEIKLTLDRMWGTNTEDWQEIKVFDSVIDLLSRAVARIFVGLPLCRNEEYLRSARTFGKNAVLISYLENILVPILRPVLIPLALIYDKLHYRKIATFISPIINERIGAFQQGQVYKKSDKTEPNDYVQWALHYAFANEDPIERTSELLMKRLAALSFASTHSSGVTLTNSLFDIFSSPSSTYLQQAIRDEVCDVTSKNPGKEWNRTSLSQMIRLDGMIKETTRLNGFSARSISKQVIAPEGITLPSGEHIPRGVIVGITATGTHHDNTIYPNADQYDPFRFTHALSVDEKIEGAQQKPSPMVTTTDEYLAFSHGSHACPGRFFASHVLKCAIAQIMLNYDVEPIEERPENVWFNNLIGPPMWSTVRVKRRAASNGAVILPTIIVADDEKERGKA